MRVVSSLPPRRIPARTLGPLLATALGAMSTAQADPSLRLQVDQRGDFAVIGNVVGHDCHPEVPAPLVGMVGDCGYNTSDTAIDVLWRAEDDGAHADTSIRAADARSTAILVLPPGAVVTHARLYWAAALRASSELPGSAPPAADTEVTMERPGGGPVPVTADHAEVVQNLSSARIWFYQSGADVTALVQTLGSGGYRVGGIGSMEIENVDDQYPFVAWWLVVFYRLESEPPRNLALFDGLTLVTPGRYASTEIQGFLVPQHGYDAKLGIVAYEGDERWVGDSFFFNHRVVSDAVNPATNFLNGTRSWLGAPVSTPGDLPRLTGRAGSHAGFDLDVVDITELVRPGDTAAAITATSSQDVYVLGAYITSIATWRPDLGASTKSVVDANGGAVRPGDVLEYTIEVRNTGNDTAVGLTLADRLAPGASFVPGSLRIVEGPGAGPKTDDAGDDQAEHHPATNTVVARLGAGSDGHSGGSLPPGAVTVLRFQVRIDPDATGAIRNVAHLTAAGERGAPATTVPTNRGEATVIWVDGCAIDADCAAPTPVCDTGTSPRACVGCLDDSSCGGTRPRCDLATRSCAPCASDGPPSCPDPSRPACNAHGPSAGACTECSLANAAGCTGERPVCLTAEGRCVGCTLDAHCPWAAVCNPETHTCEPCPVNKGAGCADPDRPTCNVSGPFAGTCTECSPTNASRCTGERPVCLQEQGICVGCRSSADCAGSTPVCDPASRTCLPCSADDTCPADRPRCLPGHGACVACVTNRDCSGTTPTCSPQSHTCEPCSASGPPSCDDPARPVCQISGPRRGACTEADDCAGGGACPQSSCDGDADCAPASAEAAGAAVADAGMPGRPCDPPCIGDHCFPPCDDGNPCTVDECDATTHRCVHRPRADGTACGPFLECMNGVCPTTPNRCGCSEMEGGTGVAALAVLLLVAWRGRRRARPRG